MTTVRVLSYPGNKRGWLAYTTFTSSQNAAHSNKFFSMLGRSCSGRFSIFIERFSLVHECVMFFCNAVSRWAQLVSFLCRMLNYHG